MRHSNLKSDLILPSGTELNTAQMQEVEGGFAPAIVLGVWGVPKLVTALTTLFTVKNTAVVVGGAVALGGIAVLSDNGMFDGGTGGDSEQYYNRHFFPNGKPKPNPEPDRPPTSPPPPVPPNNN
ncbi:MAG: hypothetical protein FWB72_02935 [Firmicutes bacterium]|nr:hypothetical protein [Bacillota bacterium]